MVPTPKVAEQFRNNLVKNKWGKKKQGTGPTNYKTLDRYVDGALKNKYQWKHKSIEYLGIGSLGSSVIQACFMGREARQFLLHKASVSPSKISWVIQKYWQIGDKLHDNKQNAYCYVLYVTYKNVFQHTFVMQKLVL